MFRSSGALYTAMPTNHKWWVAQRILLSDFWACPVQIVQCLDEMGFAGGIGAATAVNVVGEPEMLSNKYIFQSRTVWLIPSCPLFQIFFLLGCFGWLEELWLDSHKRIHFLFELVIMLHLDCWWIIIMIMYLKTFPLIGLQAKQKHLHYDWWYGD